MDKLFLAVLNMSLTASFVIAVVCLARLLLRRAPRAVSYALWAVVLFNLVCPVKPASPASMVPFRGDPVPAAAVSVAAAPDTGVSALTGPPENFWPAAGPAGGAPGEAKPWFETLSDLWAAGAGAMLLYAGVNYWRLKRRVRLAVRVRGNVYESDRIGSPFVLGLIRPRVYIPLGLPPGRYACVAAHEFEHIRRRDNLVSAAAYFALALHWFNPLVWTAYLLMLRDMETSCDEAVLRRAPEDIRCDYAAALLSFSAAKKSLPIPLAFGEKSVKGRVRDVLKFKKKPGIVIAAAVVLAVLVTAGCGVGRGADVTAVPGASPAVTSPPPTPSAAATPEAAVTPEPSAGGAGGAYSGDIPDFSAFDDGALVRYAANADGAYAEGAFSALAARLDEHMFALLETIADENSSLGNVERMNVCRGLAGEYIIEEREDEIRATLDRLLAGSRPEGTDSRPYRIAEAIRMQLSQLASLAYLGGTGSFEWTGDGSIVVRAGGEPNGGGDAGQSAKLSVSVTNVVYACTDAMFDTDLTPVAYEVILVNPGAELTIEKPYPDGASPTYRLNYGYELGNDGNTLIDRAMTVPVTEDLQGIMSREGGLPLAVIQVQLTVNN